ncbi:MAG: hypothetical protein M1150_02955 [Patescibacteria group bacterium]|nr:hypothetical protein [Patescibacteria group bacterium]
MKLLNLNDNLTLALVALFVVLSFIILIDPTRTIKSNATSVSQDLATVSLSPSKGTFRANESTPIEIKINTKGSSASGFEVTLIHSYTSSTPDIEIADADKNPKNGTQVQVASLSGVQVVKNAVTTDPVKKQIKIEVAGLSNLEKSLKTESEETLATLNVRFLNNSGQSAITFDSNETRIISSKTNKNIAKILNDGFYTIK